METKAKLLPSAETIRKLKILDERNAENEYTLKGYTKRKLNLLKNYLSVAVQDRIISCWEDGKYDTVDDYLSDFLLERNAVIFDDDETVSSLWAFDENHAEITSALNNLQGLSLPFDSYNSKRHIVPDSEDEQDTKRKRTGSSISLYSCESAASSVEYPIIPVINEKVLGRSGSNSNIDGNPDVAADTPLITDSDKSLTSLSRSNNNIDGNPDIAADTPLITDSAKSLTSLSDNPDYDSNEDMFLDSESPNVVEDEIEFEKNLKEKHQIKECSVVLHRLDEKKIPNFESRTSLNSLQPGNDSLNLNSDSESIINSDSPDSNEDILPEECSVVLNRVDEKKIAKECSVVLNRVDEFKIPIEYSVVLNRVKEKKTPKSSRSTKCRHCLQMETEVQLFAGDPENALYENKVLSDPRFNITGNDEEKCQLKITDFAIYDEKLHLCPIDTGLIEKNKKLYFSGNIISLYDDSPSLKDGVPAREIGPITEWWMTGYDGGEKCYIGISTDHGDYYLISPSSSYSNIWNPLEVKSFLSKVVIEFLIKNPDASYAELIGRIECSEPPKGVTRLGEEALLQHAQFVIEQVQSFDDAADPDENAVLTGECMQHFIKLVGVTLRKRKPPSERWNAIRLQHSKAVTTPLVQMFFQNYLPNQIEKNFGISQKFEKSPLEKYQERLKTNGNCPSVCDEIIEISDTTDETDSEKEYYIPRPRAALKNTDSNARCEEWIGSPDVHSNKSYFTSVLINGNKINIGDHVFVSMPDYGKSTLAIAKVIYMYEYCNQKKKVFHAHWLRRGSNTVLGETAHAWELFLIDDCEDLELKYITEKCEVIHRPPPNDWHELGGSQSEADMPQELKCYFFQKWYDPIHARFEDPPSEYLQANVNKPGSCACCQRLSYQNQLLNPRQGDFIGIIDDTREYLSFTFKKQIYYLGDCIYIDPTELKFAFIPPEKSETPPEKSEFDKDEDTYPEFYRKFRINKSRAIKPEPFKIAYIEKIYQDSHSDEILIKVRVFYRPENTNLDPSKNFEADLHLLYWSDEEATISAKCVQGKCYVAYGGNIKEEIDEYISKGFDRFYFWEAFNFENLNFEEPQDAAKTLGKLGNNQFSNGITNKKLKAMDVFSGCGGLSDGLHQAGICETLWAIEQYEPAAKAFKLNNPNAAVFQDDCNKLLKDIMEGKTYNKDGQKLPRKGEVELLCGGPPCQGFSSMNRFTEGQYSLFKNSLVVTFLSYCDYFRPKFFILENVRSFLNVKKHLVLKLTLGSLIRMGYQCTFGICQAGHYGVAQTRRRAFILAAAPGEKLPQFPEPIYTFQASSCNYVVSIDDMKYTSDISWIGSAPLRTMTVKDVIFDLPKIPNGSRQEVMSYKGNPKTHIQRMIRDNQEVLKEHVCKEVNPLVLARIQHVPPGVNNDWRDIPNIIVRLSDGRYTKKLLYNFDDRLNGRSSTGALRGVCLCVDGKKSCEGLYRQSLTLIPWHLVHTANKNNNWDGCIGRLNWNTFCITICTNPEPVGGKVGRVVHPEQDRVLSVRECARLQGFKDSFRFCGNILDRHRQIGNAVPPPLAYAIGLQIKKCL